MAYSNAELAITVPAAADYSTTGQYLFVNIDGNGRALLVSSQGADAIGVLSDKPAAIDRPARVVIGGVTKCIAGETITPDDKLTTGADGRAEVALTGDHVVAHAVTGGADGEVITISMTAHPILA